MTITGAGVHAGVTAAAGGNGITISAAGATVILRELTVTGNNGAGANGIQISAAAPVYIERSVVTDFNSDGIFYNTNGRLFITDTISRDNGGDGVNVNGLGGTARVNIDGSRFERNGSDGIDFNDGNFEASITNSLASDNDGDGVQVGSSSGAVRVQISQTTAANNGNSGFLVGFGDELNIEYSVARGNAASGMGVLSGGTIRVSNSVSTNNQFGFRNANGTFESRGNNTVAGNGTQTSGAITNITGT